MNNVELNKFFVIKNTFVYQGKKQESIVQLKAHEKKRCIPIFKNESEAQFFTTEYPGHFEIIQIGKLDEPLQALEDTSRQYFYIYLGLEGIQKLKNGELDSQEKYSKYL